MVYEAQKFLAEELQRLSSEEEPGLYTKLSETELVNIMAILEKETVSCREYWKMHTAVLKENRMGNAGREA